MQSERSVYRVLVRHFFNRLFDNETIASNGSLSDSAVTVISLMGAAGVVIAYTTVVKHWLMNVHTPEAIREAVAWSDREFMISMSMAVVAAVAILCWESVFPDRRDCLILSVLPVRQRDMIVAKLTVLGGVFLAATTAINFVSTFFFPIATMRTATAGEGLLAYTAHILAVGAASAFVFLASLAAQGLLVNLLPYRLFQRVSAWVQMLALFGVLFVFFVIPPISTFGRLIDPDNRQAALLLPPFWFLGLYQTILGTRHPFIEELAARAVWALVGSAIAAAVLYAIGYRRLMRRTVEESGAVGDSGVERWRWLSQLLDRLWLHAPTERAAFHYTWRTMTRNRGHRLMLAAYAAVGLVYVVDGVAALVNKSGGHALMKPNAELSGFALILPFFVLLGLRALFSLPMELRANWIFRLTDLGRPGDYVRGARKLMLSAGILPVCILSLPIYAVLWGWRLALAHIVICILVSMTVLDLLMTGFCKMPFTCPFMPGKGNLKVAFAAYVVLFLILAYLLVHLELWLVSDSERSMTGIAIAAAVWLWALRRRRVRDAEEIAVMWEEPPVWHLQTLELSR